MLQIKRPDKMDRKPDKTISKEQNDNAVARTLLIELLAYQFAFPVRWIETQQELLSQSEKDMRYIEIGPTKLLSTMGSKTAQKCFLVNDDIRLIKRQFLSYSDDYDEICYSQQSSRSDSAIADSQLAPVDNRAKSIRSEPNLSNIESKSIPVSTKIIEDCLIKASDIITAIAAHKFRLSFDQLPMGKSISHLSGGKSTLQNELVGDLVEEFHSIPDRCEDMSLAELGQAIQASFKGKLGKVSIMLTSKLFASKFPAGWTQAIARSYLQQNWSIGPHRQTTLLCFLATKPPAQRLEDTDQAKKYIDEIMQLYMKYTGLTFYPSESHDYKKEETTMDPKIMQDQPREQQHDSFKKLYQTLANITEPQETDTENREPETAKRLATAEEQLQIWHLEFGDEFLAKIAPRFDTRKIRVYNSWWNWGRVDILEWVKRLNTNSEDLRNDSVRDILNRCDSSCLDILTYELDSMSSRSTHSQKREILQSCILSCRQALTRQCAFKYHKPALGPRTEISSSGLISYHESPRCDEQSDYYKLTRNSFDGKLDDNRIQLKKMPFIHLMRRNGHITSGEELIDQHLTEIFFQGLDTALSLGLSFTDKTILITGAGPQSIGAEVVKSLLRGGCRVIMTTSGSNYGFYESMYREACGKKSELIVIPFNQASKQDCENLASHIYANILDETDIDCIIPFAAISENGREIDDIDTTSEIAHRAMLVNLIRLLGYIKHQKASRGRYCNPTHVILPLSPNHGIFGGDGLYSESKIGLETLFARFHSESWSKYLSICGAIVGWTRGTGLMSANDIIAQTIEEQGVLTFSAAEMALNIVVLATLEIIHQCEDAPIIADLSGGLRELHDVKRICTDARQDLKLRAAIRKAVFEQDERERSNTTFPFTDLGSKNTDELANLQTGYPTPVDQNKWHHTAARPPNAIMSNFTKLANVQIPYPILPRYADMIAGLSARDVNLSKTIVIVGYSELGPWGNSRTRWEMEQSKKLSLQGCVEMAWIMGLVSHHEGKINGKDYVGWIDAKSREPVADHDFQDRYGHYIGEHSGIRFVEPELFDGYDPFCKEFLQEVVVDSDLPEFKTTVATANAFKLKHKDKVSIKNLDNETCSVHFKAGARFLIPKAQSFDRSVAGQIPTGWDPKTYGIPDDVISQVDAITLYMICCVSEAMLTAGIKDPYELYRYIHLSEVANCVGTGAGGLRAMRGVYQDRYLDRDVQGDILQESFANATSAWVNMLLLGAAGPIKTPSGTCATALESLDIGCETIQCGKARVAIVGGTDDLQEEMSYEFANMKATANTVEELARGRGPREMSRPTAASRAGFLESAGCGVQIIMTADLALEMGLPIYGVVAFSQMSGDKIGRSVPAPGKGVLTAAKEFNSTTSSSNPSPLRAALFKWDLDIDDIDVTSLHGTSTKANDYNESNVVNIMMQHLGRSLGNPLLVVCQKHLTGHPKGAAAAWMLNGGLQILQSAIVPGNQNADNIDGVLKDFKHLVYPTRSISVERINAVMITSFGFGQKGGLAICIHPRFLFAAIGSSNYESYRLRCNSRTRDSNNAFVKRLNKNSVVQVKLHPAWQPEDEARVMLDPNARVSLFEGEYKFIFDSDDSYNDASSCTETLYSPSVKTPLSPLSDNMIGESQTWLEDRISSDLTKQIGVDVESIAAINTDNEVFIQRNYTEEEQQFCLGAPNSRQSFAGRWAAKEAVFKSLKIPSNGPGAAMKEIEIESCNGIPTVKLRGETFEIAQQKGIRDIQVSISHSEDVAFAVAIASCGRN